MQVWTLGLVLLLVGQVIAQGRGSRRYQVQPQGNEAQDDAHVESRNNGRRAQEDFSSGRQSGRRVENTRQDVPSHRSRHETRQPEATRQVPSIREGRRETQRDIQRDEVYRTEIPELVRHQPRQPDQKQEQESRQGRGRFSSRYLESSEVTKNPSERTGRQRKFEDRIPPKASEEESSTERVFLSRNNNARQPQRSRSEDQPRFKSREETDDVSTRSRGRERTNDRTRVPSRQPTIARQESREDIRSPERARSPPIEVKTNHRFQSRGNERSSPTTTATTPERRAPRPRPIPPPAEDSSEILQADSLGSPTRQTYRPRQPTLALKPKQDIKTSARITSTQDRGSAKGPTLNTKSPGDEVLEEDNYPAVYKQLKKQGKAPQEILALLKLQKNKVQEAESISTNIISPPPGTTPSQERNDLFTSNERVAVPPTPSTPTDTLVETVQSPKLLSKASRPEKPFPGRNNRPIGLRPIPISLREKSLPLIEEPLDVQQVYQKVNEKYSRESSRSNGAFKNGRNRERFDSKAEGTQSKDIQAEQVVKVPYGNNKGQIRKEKVSLPKLKLAGQDEATFSRRDDRNIGGSTRPSFRNNGIAYPKRKETVNKYAETISRDELLSMRRPPSRSGLLSRRKESSSEANLSSKDVVEDVTPSIKEETVTEVYQSKSEQALTSRNTYRQEGFLGRKDARNEVVNSSEQNNNNEVTIERSEEERSDQNSREQSRKSTKTNLAPKDTVYSWIIDSENSYTTEKAKFIPQNPKRYSARISEKSESVTETTGMKPRYELYQRNKNNILSRKVAPTSGPEDNNKASEEEVNVSNKYFNRPRPTFIPQKKTGKYTQTPLSAVPRFRARKAAENRPSRRNVENNSGELKMETSIEEKNQSSEKKSSIMKESHIQKVPNKYKLNVSTKASIGRRTAGTTEGTVTSPNESLEQTTVQDDVEDEKESDASEESDDNEEETDDDGEESDDNEEEDEENDPEESSSESPNTELVEGRSNDSSSENQEVTTEKDEEEDEDEDNAAEKEDEENEENDEEMNETDDLNEDDETNNEESENATKMEETATESSSNDNESESNDTALGTSDNEIETKSEDNDDEEGTTEENEDTETDTEEAEDVTESIDEENSEENSENDDSEPESRQGATEDEEDTGDMETTEAEIDDEETTETDSEVTTESTENESSNEESGEASDNDDKTESPNESVPDNEEVKETEESTESSTTKTDENEGESSNDKNESKTNETSDIDDKINDIDSTNQDSENEIDDNTNDLGTRNGIADDADENEADADQETTTASSTTTSESTMQGTTTKISSKIPSKEFTTAKPMTTLGAPSNINDLPSTTPVAITPPTFRSTPNSPTPHFSWGGGCCSSSVIIVTPGTPTPTTPVSRTSILSSLGFAVDKLTSGSYFAVTTPLPSPNSIPTRKAYPTKLKDSRFVYALTPDNRVVRKIVHTTQAPKDVPFIIFGLYPNGTIVRRFPNGTAVPEEMTEANEVIGTIPNPKYTKEHLEYIIQRDKSLAYLYPDRYLSAVTTPNQFSTTARQGRTESFIQRIGASTHAIGLLDPSNLSTTTSKPLSTSGDTLLRIQQEETTPLEEPSTTVDDGSATTTDLADTTTTIENATTTTTEATTTTASTTTSATTAATTSTTTVRATTKKSKKKNGRKSSNKRTSKKNKTSTTTTKKPVASTTEENKSTEGTTTPSTTSTTTEPTTTPSTTTTTTTEATTTLLPTTTEEATTIPPTTTTTQGTTPSTTTSTEAASTTKKSKKSEKQIKPSASTATPRTGSRKSSKKPKGTSRTNSNNGSRKPKTSSKTKTKSTTKPTTSTTTPVTTVSLAPPVPAIVSTTATPILATTVKSKASTVLPKQDPITIDPEIRNRLSDIEILNNFLKTEGAGSGDIPNADLAQKVIQLAIERAQKTSTVASPYDNIQALASSTSAISTTNKIGVTGSPLDKTTGGKISVWVVPPEGDSPSKKDSLSDAEIERLNQLLASPSSVEGLSPNEQLIVADIISSTGNPLAYPTSRNSKQFSSSTRNPFLQAFFPEGRPALFGGSFMGNPHYGPADQASKQVEEDSGLVQSAINITKAVSQFMSFVIQGAVQNFQTYVSTRTQALARYLSSTPPRQ